MNKEKNGNKLVALKEFLERHLSYRNKILLLSIVVGIGGAFAAVLLKNLVFYTNSFLHDSFLEGQYNYLYLIFPIVGIILTALYVNYVVKDDISHGVSKILYALSRNKGRIKSHNMYSSLIASTLTVGFGGSVGLEAPITFTGSAIGSNIGKHFNVSRRSMITLVACGSTAALAAIFKAPIAAVVFALEILMLDITMASVLPLLLSAITGITISYLFLGREVIFSMPQTIDFSLGNIPFYALLGVFCGLVSVYLIRMTALIEGAFAKIRHRVVKFLVGGVCLGGIIFMFPLLYGEGYGTLNNLINGNVMGLLDNSPFYGMSNMGLLFGFFLLVLVFKVIAMAITTGAGGVGGTFAPSLFMGGVAGSLFALFVNTFMDWQLPVLNFTLAGMAGVMAGVMHAPLTAMFLIAELTGGYGLFIPLMLTTASAYLTVRPMEPNSIYTRKLAARGELLTHHTDRSVLDQMDIDELIEKDFLTIDSSACLGDLIKKIEHSTRNAYPVIDAENKFLGVVFMDDIRNKIFHPELYQTPITDLMFMPVSHAVSGEKMSSAVEKFNESGYYNLPVLSEDGKYVGFISRANVFATYRHLVEEFSEE